MVDKVLTKIKSVKHFKCIAIFLLSFVIGCILILSLFLARTPIQDATANDLKEINGIGAMKASQIEKFYDMCPECGIDDALQIDGIGEITVHKLKEKYR